MASLIGSKCYLELLFFAFQAIKLKNRINKFTESDSIQSTESSVTASRRGPSEEGGERRQQYIPVPPPPTRGSYWLLQQRSNRTLGGHSRQCTIRFQSLNSTAEELDEIVDQTSSAFGDLISKTLLQSSELLARQHNRASGPIGKLNSDHTTDNVKDNVLTETEMGCSCSKVS